MSGVTEIEWADRVWNPVLGCAKVSEGCRRCYAIPQAWMKQSNPSAKVREAYSGLVEKRTDGSLNWTGRVNLVPERLELPLTWKKPKRIFVNSLSDLFHESVPDEFIDRVFATMAITDHTYLVLTKRPHRMSRYLTDSLRESAVIEAMDDDYDAVPAGQWTWPLPNVWVGTSTEDQRTADERIPHLLAVPAAVRFLSAEPLLGPVDLTNVSYSAYLREFMRQAAGDKEAASVGNEAVLDVLHGTWDDGWDTGDDGKRIHWVIAGGESGPKARPMHPDWVRSLRDQCVSAGVPFHFKQWGEWLPTGHVNASGEAEFTRVGKQLAGRELDGRTWDEFPGGRLP